MLRARDITGEEFHHTVADVDTLQQLAGMLPENPVIVNVGACFGTSALAMLEARPDAFIFSIDINVCPKERKHIEESEYDAGRVVRVLGSSQDAGVYWPHRVDMAFIDGAHHYSGVQRDIQAWGDKADVLAFHDYENEHVPHVKLAIDDEMGNIEPLLQTKGIRAYG